MGCVRFRGLLPMVVLLLAGSGCAAVKATQQPDKKDLGVLSPGVPRTNVIAELGAPVWSEQRESGTVDVFAFKQGYSKEVKAGRALLHGTGDVLTMGLWEVVGIPAESIANGTDVKVEITYDTNQMVQDVHVIKGEEVVHPQPMFARKTPREPAIAAGEEAATVKQASHQPWLKPKMQR